MSDSFQDTDQAAQVGINTTTTTQSSQSILLKRNPHLRETSQMSSPAGFGGLGTRQFVRKQLVTPGSATSASSFEEGTSTDGLSDAGTPASDRGSMTKSTEIMQRLTKQPTKKLSSPSRESLMRRLVDGEEDRSQADGEGDDLLPSVLLDNIVVKRVPTIYVKGEAKALSTSITSLTSPSAKLTRRIAVSPRKNMRRVVVRNTGADGQIQEQVRYIDADGQVVQQGSNVADGATEETSTISLGRSTIAGWDSAPATTLRRVVVRKTGADGQVHEEAQFVNADGNVVDGEGVAFNVATSSMIPTPVVTRHIVTPRKLTQRTLRRTGADGQVHVQVQYLDVCGNIVRTEGEDFDSISDSSGAAVTRRIVTPGKTTRRVVVRRTEADGQVHEEVQYMDADSNVVQSDGTALVTTSGSDTTGFSSGRTTVTRRIVSPGQTYAGVDGNVLPTFRMDGHSVSVEQHIAGDGQIYEDEGRALSSVGSFSGSVSSVTSDISTTTSSRRIVTRRLVASPNTVPAVPCSVLHKAGSSSDAEYEDVQYVEPEDADLTTKVVASQNGPGRRVTTRRVVTPHRVVRRMVVRKGTAGSDTEGVNGLDIDADSALSEDNASSDESVGGSSRGKCSVSDRIVIPTRTRQVVSRTASPSDKSQKNLDVVTVPLSEKFETTASLGGEEKTSSFSSRDGATRTSSASKGSDVDSTKVDGDSQETPNVRVAGAVVGAAVVASANGNNNSSQNVIEGVLAVDEQDTTVTEEIAEAEKDGERPHAVSESWDIFGKTEKKMARTDVACSDDKKPATSTTAVAPHNEELVDAPEAGKADASSVVAGFNLQSKPKHSTYQDHNIVAEIPRDSDVAAVTADDFASPSIMGYTKGAASATTASIVDAPASSNSAVITSFVTCKAHQELPTPQGNENKKTAALHETSTLDEDKTPVASAENVNIPVLHAATKSLGVFPASSRVHNFAQIPAVTGTAGVASVVEIDPKEPEFYSSTDLAKTEIADTLDRPHAAVAITDEDGSNMPHRKTERSMWKFWGAQKPKAFIREDEKLSDGGEREEGLVAADAEMADKIGSPVIRDQGAIVESPRAGVAGLAHTTIEVEEELESGRLFHNTAASAFDNITAADVIVAPESQQLEERKTSARKESMEDKPERAVGLWGFFGKKAKSEQPAVVMSPVSSGNSVSWAIEGEDDKITPDSTTHNDEIVAAAQAESICDCIQSDSILTNAAAPVASSEVTIRDSERRTTELMDNIEPDIESNDHYVSIASPRRRCAHDADELWTVKACSLAWSNLCLNRKSWKTSSTGITLSGSDEAVLQDVSGTVKAGEFLVITGPSRDESLALMSCLAGFEDAMEGNVTVNGREWSEKMNRYIGYVMQEDLFYETLTVQEHLTAQARLRVGRTHTDEICLKRVERVIDDMCLSDCRDKLIGGGLLVRGITRGERKLLALATALLTNPSILFVEEPTDDLDTFGAEKIVAKLRWLAFEKGLTVIVTLHHPSSHFYELFDVLYLLADASCVYDGKAAACIAYFSMIGYQCPEYVSPIDYFMLQMVVGDQESDDAGVARVDALKREWTQRKAALYAGNVAHVAAMSEDVVVDEYDQKNCYDHMGCCGQLWLLWARHVRRLSRYGFVFQWHLLAALLIGVVVGLVYLQIDLKGQHGIQNFAGAFFYVVVVQMLFTAYRTFVFMPRETAVALRERQESRGDSYNLLCWYLTKIAAELPAIIILSIVLFVPVFLLVGIGYGFEVYVYMQIVMVLAGWTGVGLAFATVGILRHVTLALIVYTILLMLFSVFGGLLINVTDISDWFVWLHYISPIKYSYESMMKIFWKRVDNIDCDGTLEGCVAFTGDGVLEYYSMEKRSALSDSLILLAICLSLFFVAFWFLLALANKRISGLQWRYDWDFKGPLGGYRQQRVASSVISKSKAATRSSMHHIERKSQHSSSAVVKRSTVVETENHYISIETPRAGGRVVCDTPSMTLGWSSLWLKAPIDKNSKSNSEMQHLLCDASGSAKCGELILITGPSDDSNVALLESLGGLRTINGKVTLNGVVLAAHKLSHHVAYVTRDNLFYETLTVEEHLRFQAELAGKSSEGCGLCCGAGTSDVEAEEVEQVLDELELTSKRHILIRYLSEADTKLLAVATALLTGPSVLLAEEPTCGMDFYASHRVVLKLRQLARGGRTVVVTMTHPSSHVYAMFDTLHLLAGGAAVYHGKVREAVSYFSSLGYLCPQYMSPVDYFVRQVSVRKNDNETGDVQAALFKEAWSTRYSELCLADNMDESKSQDEEGFSRLRVGCCGQLLLLFQRHVLRLARYRAVFGWHSFWMIVASTIFGLIFLQLDVDDQQDIQNWAGAFFFLIVLQMLVMAYRTFVFLPREMDIVEREYRIGSYYLVSWYLTKVLTELPAMLVLSMLLFVPAYLLIGIGHGFKLYVYMQFVMWLVGWSAIGLASLLLDVFRHVRAALIVYMLLLILFVVFGGLLINIDDLPNYLIWLHYISPVKYGYEALMKLFWGRIGFLACGGRDGSGSESDGVMLADSSYGSGSYKDDDGCIAHSGDEVLTYYSMDMARGSRSDSFILLELTLLCFFIGCAMLSLRWHRNKRH